MKSGERGKVGAEFLRKCDQSFDNSMHTSMKEHAERQERKEKLQQVLQGMKKEKEEPVEMIGADQSVDLRRPPTTPKKVK